MRAETRFASLPPRGRVFRAERTVRLGDAGPDRRARLDALARFLHDVAEDDAADSGLDGGVGWVVRKTSIAVLRFPTLGETAQLETFCSAVAARWAERTTTLSLGGRPVVQGVSVWVAVDASTGAPVRLGDRFHEVFGPSAAGRRASARLGLPTPPPAAREGARPWPLRSTDFDVWGHVNNAISWAAVEDALEPGGLVPLRADLEHVDPVGPGAALLLASDATDGEARVWLLDASRGAASVVSAARLATVGPPLAEARP